jgi:FMN phosphatase YigB (HAD superfamily)
LSFDVFDTAITRIWFRPEDLFAAVERELSHAGLYRGGSGPWAETRIRAERDLRRALNSTHSAVSEEISLTAIHDHLATLLSLSPEVRHAAIRLELSLERAASRPIAETRAAILQARAAGQRVVFLSDTYFDEDFVLELLERAGMQPSRQELFTSLSQGYTKRYGSLFVKLMTDLVSAPADIRHLGDNVASDVVAARKLGVNSTLFTTQRANRYESRLYAPMEGVPTLLRAAVAGAARAARLSRHESHPRMRQLFETGAVVAAPLLTGFVLWVLIEARRRGLQRLYFLSRDGQILQRIATRLTAWLDWTIDARYLYASRQSLFLPSILEFGDSVRDWLLEDASDTTLRAVLSRIEMDNPAEAATLSEAGFSPTMWDQRLQAEGAARLRALTHRRDFIERVAARAGARRELLLDYLVQEGCTEGTTFALVDIGWKGRLQRCIAQAMSVLPGCSPERLIGFYFGLSRRPDPAAAGQLIDYVKAPLPNAALLETFVKADHGSVRRFQRSADGSVGPELTAPLDVEAIEWGLGAQQGGILEFVELLLSALQPSDVAPEVMVRYLSERGRMNFDLFTHHPSAEEAAAYGSLRHAADQTHDNPKDTAPLIAPGQVLNLLFKRHNLVERHTSWPEGSIARATPRPLERRLLLALWESRRAAASALRRRPS